MRFLAMALLAALLFPFALLKAETPPPQPALRALLIGCDRFVTQPDTWPAAENNVRILSDALAKDIRGYALIRSLSGSVATKEGFQRAVEEAFQNAGENDVSLLYISTHGMFSEGVTNAEAGLLLSDGETETLLDAAVLQEILDQVPGNKIVILDACNSGAIIGKGLSGGAAQCFLTGKSYHVLCSAGGSEASWYYQSGGEGPASGASYFASVLTNGLGVQGACSADINADGLVTLAEMYAYLLDNYAASTPQVYPQGDDGLVLFAYDPDNVYAAEKAVTDVSFQDTLLTAGQTDVTFSFTVRRQTHLYYQIVYHRDGVWQFAQAQHFLDGEQADGTVLPGRKMRTLSLNTGEDASGYVIIQLLSMEDDTPLFEGARLLCVQPATGSVRLAAVTGASFVPTLGQEMAIWAEHDVPCGLTVNILNESGRVVRRIAYDVPSRPQHLSPAASSFYWDGRKNDGEMAEPGAYRAQIKTRMNGEDISCVSDVFYLEVAAAQ